MVLRRHPSQVHWATQATRGTAILALAATALAGCSADIRRLERPSYSVGERPATPVPQEGLRRNAGAPPSVDNSGWPSSGTQRPQQSMDRVAALPDSAAQPVQPQTYSNPSVPFDAPKKAKAAPAAAAQPVQTSAPIAAGQAIEVQQGDSLFAISKRHNVSIAALMELNGLKSATLKPGQKLVLPANARRPLAKAPEPKAAPTAVGAPVAVSAPAPVAVTPAAPAPAPVIAAAPATTDWTGTHVVQSGESLFGIARAHKVKPDELQRANGITDPSKMRQGMTLKVPAHDGALAPVQAALPVTQPVRTAAAQPVALPTAQPTATDVPRAAAGTGGVHILNAPGAATAQQPAAQLTKTAAAAGAAPKFRWPAKGPTLAGFGKRPDGAHNDGINIGVAAGTDIAAAEAGTVAYAGSEIKAYGNLVLIRHDGGWVTAYAHADQILVKRGDQVTRGQVIAKAGTTGTVDQPQVHFELRQGSKPVDPAPHMEK